MNEFIGFRDDLMIDYTAHLTMFSRFNFNTFNISNTRGICYKCVLNEFNDFVMYSNFCFLCFHQNQWTIYEQKRNSINHLRIYITCANNTMFDICLQ